MTTSRRIVCIWQIAWNFNLIDLDTVVLDAYTVIGADDTTANGYSMILTSGETREVYVFYYFYT